MPNYDIHMGTSKRKFIRTEPVRGGPPHGGGIVYLVYTYKSGALSSDGPYADEDIAVVNMQKFLSKGVCSWVVSYNA